jgi:hypothetical protein
MDDLGMVGTLAARGWRPYAAPVAFLLAATVAIGLLRGHLSAPRAASPPRTAAAHQRPSGRAPAHRAPAHLLYVVRAGDTIAAIASTRGTTTARLLKLNPTVSPTALFIGEKLRLR